MILLATVANLKGELNQVSCGFQKLEEVIEFLKTIHGLGDQIVSAHIWQENGDYFEIPLEMLDEDTDQSPLQQLRKQWEQALSIKEDRQQPDQGVGILKQRWLESNRSRISHLQSTIGCIAVQLLVAQERLPDGFSRDVLISHYNKLLEYYQTQLRRLMSY